jgi:hypothetical protein
MDTESFKNACNGKSAGAGGLNLPEFKRETIQLYPAHKNAITSMSRKQLEDFCKQNTLQPKSPAQLPQLQPLSSQSRLPGQSSLLPLLPSQIRPLTPVVQPSGQSRSQVPFIPLVPSSVQIKPSTPSAQVQRQHNIRKIYAIAYLPLTTDTGELIEDVDIVQLEARDQTDAIEKFIDIAFGDIDENGETISSIRLFLTDFILTDRHYIAKNPTLVRFDEIRNIMAQEYNDGDLGDNGVESDIVRDFIRRHRDDYIFLLQTSIAIEPMYFKINEFVLRV